MMRTTTHDVRRFLVLTALAVQAGLLVPEALAQEQTQPPGVASTADEGSAAKPGALERGVDLARRVLDGDGGSRKGGFYVHTGSMVTGAGVAVGPGYRHWLCGRTALGEVSAAYSWRGYKVVRTRFELPALARGRLTLGAQYRWQDALQVSYFGDGPASVESAQSEYRLTSHDVIGYADVKLAPTLSVQARTGRLLGPTLRAPTGHFQRGYPNALESFSKSPAISLNEQPSYLLSDLTIVSDGRDNAGYPRRGGLYRAAWMRVDDRDDDRFSFQRYGLEAAHFRPLTSDRVVVALRGWMVMTHSKPGRAVPFYLLPSMGGNNTLRGFHNYRFHDRHMVVANAEARIAVLPTLDAAVFFDAGNVAPRVRDLNLNRTTLGVGLRLHSMRTTFARFDVAHGREGWRFIVTRSDPLNLARRSLRAVTIPFVP